MYKIKEKINFVDDYVVFDIETTGFDSENDKIIEISAIKYINNKEVSVFSYLIDPKIPLPNVIKKITNIDDKDLVNKPTINEILPLFLKFIEGYTVIGHNVKFDISFINSNAKKLNLKEMNNEVIDTLALARNTIFDTKNYKLETLKKYLNLNFNSHRAEDDCYTCNEVYRYCRNLQKIDEESLL